MKKQVRKTKLTSSDIARLTSDVQVHAVALCSGTSIQRKKREMRLIFQLSTIRPKRLNINFSFIWIRTLNHLALAITGERAAIIFMSTVYCVILYSGFFSHWRRVINPKRLCFSKKIDTFRYSLPNITSSAIQDVLGIIGRFYARDVEVV